MTSLRELLSGLRYEVIPAKGTEQAVADVVPAGMTVTVTASPVKGLEPTVELADYVAAQAYAVALIGSHCRELEPDDPPAAAKRLRTSTFFGDFRLAGDGLQVGHRLAVVQWRNGSRRLRPSTRA